MKSRLTKAQLRTNITSLIKNNEHFIEVFSEKSLRIIESQLMYLNATHVFAYYPMQGEASCLKILEDALIKNKVILLPKISNTKMDFYMCNTLAIEGNFFKNSYGILEPKEDLSLIFTKTLKKDTFPSIIMFIPGLAFTKSGKRLGRGKAYYDSFLTKFQEDAVSNYNVSSIILIGICCSIQVLDDIPTEEHDVMVDFVLTENDLYNCNDYHNIQQ